MDNDLATIIKCETIEDSEKSLEGTLPFREIDFVKKHQPKKMKKDEREEMKGWVTLEDLGVLKCGGVIQRSESVQK